MGALFNTTTSSNSTDVPNLEPGTRYSINVKTRAATGSESTEEQTFSYTSKAVHLNTCQAAEGLQVSVLSQLFIADILKAIKNLAKM